MLPAKVVVFGVGALARSLSDSHIRMSLYPLTYLSRI